ncbi:Amidase [Niveomyces insectorum RCEF 264]|uniref:Amidase n=1 Tax=Niveomyces insectorum RCEF 264 TaxID=1081102 RepID=A0A167N9L7_9HYPO|nr:Amidase [Niveomyces insectorum RCEF 264]
MESWETIASACQSAVLNAIPDKWKLPTPPAASVTDVTGIPRSCGLLTPAQLDITEQTADALVKQLRSGQLTSVEVTEAFCARAAIAHQCVNCLTSYFYEEALARAKKLDDILKTTGKPVGPLHGLPIAIKDHFLMKGKPATFAAVAWHNNIADSDASIVEALQNAGVVPFARTTMPQTGMMLQTVSNLWGRTLNPFNRGFSAGGSSGGDGALVGMHGSPFCPSTDIGGSIRAPATFNGLYGIRPTAERIPKTGLTTSATGQISIKVSCGPICHSVADIKLATQVVLQHYDYIGYEPSCIPFPWNDSVALPEKLCFGVLRNDGVVTPHPPIQRSINETVQRLEAAGHKVIEFQPPLDFWEMAQDLWKLYFQTGAKETKALVAASGEPLTENFSWYLDTFKIKELTVPELFKLNTKLGQYRRQFYQIWTATKEQTGTGRPMDGLICPCAPSAGFPHEFPVWWGYFALWNLLDYPSTILPLKGFKIDPKTDPKDTTYVPKTNTPFDRMNAEIYDPELWKNQPVCVQIVKPPFKDEELIAVTEVVDAACNR